MYKELIVSKSGENIPVFENGRTFHSKYNPQQEAENFTAQIEASDVFFITGYGAGFFVKKLMDKFPESLFLIVESSVEDINFIKTNFPDSNVFFEKENVKIFSYEETEKFLLKNYLPAIFPNFKVIEIRSWITENQDIFDKIVQKINESIKKIKADFSVQVHFGKKWQRNLLKNVKFAKNINNVSIDTSKKAVIVAAGPSLDSKIEELRKNRNDYYIISTDTAFTALSKQGIFCDAVVSIDGQLISKNHFLHKLDKNTLAVIDLQGSTQAVRKLQKNGNQIIFASNHPLAFYLENLSGTKSFIPLSSGSGTVTIAAVDFAFKSGFKDILIFGADFSYKNNKPYTRGTYLDDLFETEQSKINSKEGQFSKLTFRTELIKLNEETKTTEILDSYRQSFENWIIQNQLKIVSTSNNVYEILNERNAKTYKIEKFNVDNYNDNLKNELNSANSDKINRFSLSPFQISLLPFIAHERIYSKAESFEELLERAIKDFAKFTEVL